MRCKTVWGTHMHSLPPRTDSERTRKSCPSEILTTSAALGSSAIHADDVNGRSFALSQRLTYAKLCQALR